MASSRKALGITGFLILALLAIGAHEASAKDLCLLVGGAVTLVAKGTGVPTKGTCKPWAGFIPEEPGNILTGVVCTTSDGSQLQANQYTSIAGEELLSVISLPGGSGTTNDCSVGGGCFSSPVVIEKCPKLQVHKEVAGALSVPSSTLNP